ncbi:hypothetical protein C4N9_15865 [Pararhodobacter marinus]|uniref:Aminotransferase class V domain-containing protein n=1 Tax=Pararhodobacter marinus TaxID=2184063 RepID=A0A2U2C6N8_9RHOB|nr:aminotransferase class V-fold PLP-dependent enzyme [Pararhodobacter marinus]PWE27522.1 hypothetical protein C4N9_15865 [Pararhodobacter marinus]
MSETIDTLDFRRDFPHLDRCIYLNTAATGLAAPGTGEAAARMYGELQSRGYDAQPLWMAERRRVLGLLARLLNVEADWIDFASSSTDALTRALQALPLKAGERVVVPDDDFPSVKAALEDLKSRGITVARVPIADEAQRTEALIDALPGASLLAVSHVHWETGTRVDLARLSAACRARGTLLAVDGVHAVGAIPVDASLADVYVTSFFKWTLAGFGLGLGVVRPALRERLEPRQRGYANLAPSRLLAHSHANYPGIFVLGAALDYLEKLGHARIENRVAKLQAELSARLIADGFAVATPPEAAAGIVALKVPDPEGLARSLDERGIRTSPRGAMLRLSPHFYNSSDDLAACCAALVTLAGQDA